MMRWMRQWPIGLACLMLAGLLIAAMTLAITLGSVSLYPGTVWRILLHEMGQRAGLALLTPDWSIQHYQIVWMIRMPRILLAALVGAGLATVGVVMQAMVRNPLADRAMATLAAIGSAPVLGAASAAALAAASAAVLAADQCR